MKDAPEIYCPTCGSCGDAGCCGLRCSFLDSHREDYREMERDAEAEYQRAERLEAALHRIAGEMPRLKGKSFWAHHIELPWAAIHRMHKIALNALAVDTDTPEVSDG